MYFKNIKLLFILIKIFIYILFIFAFKNFNILTFINSTIGPSHFTIAMS